MRTEKAAWAIVVVLLNATVQAMFRHFRRPAEDSEPCLRFVIFSIAAMCLAMTVTVVIVVLSYFFVYCWLLFLVLVAVVVVVLVVVYVVHCTAH